MMQDIEPTAVIFRKFRAGGLDGPVIALFPELPGTTDDATCMSYMHIGQHGGARVSPIFSTVPATPAEYADLQAELTDIGYNLRVCRRFTRRARAIRAAQIASWELAPEYRAGLRTAQQGQPCDFSTPNPIDYLAGYIDGQGWDRPLADDGYADGGAPYDDETLLIIYRQIIQEATHATATQVE